MHAFLHTIYFKDAVTYHKCVFHFVQYHMSPSSLIMQQRHKPSLLHSLQYAPLFMTAKLEQKASSRHRFLHLSSYDIDSFCVNIDPLLLFCLSSDTFLFQTPCKVTTNIASKRYVFASNLDSPPTIVLDSGASLCITPDKNDFNEPLQSSQIKIISVL